jgi:CRISPR system Cascade subunit CasE
MGEPATLYMHRLRLEVAGMIGLARRRRLPVRDVDLGYIAHLQLGELFGGDPPQPFTVTGMSGRWVTLLAYSERPQQELRDVAQACADPAIYNTLAWEHFDSKPMPPEWRAGQRLGFEVRVCPVVRMSSDGPHWSRGTEVDAFLAACWKTGDPSVPVARDEVYRDWLVKRIEASGARVLEVRMNQFKLERLIRRTHGEERTSRTLERPAAAFAGALEVVEATGFDQLLRRGVGRHRAFGFGMVLLRNPTRARR